MTAFFKTLFGDAATVGVVMAIMVAEVALGLGGAATYAAFGVPWLVLGGIMWLALR